MSVRAFTYVWENLKIIAHTDSAPMLMLQNPNVEMIVEENII